MKTLLLTVFAFSLTTASAADLSSEFQTTSRDTEFAELMAKLNLNAEGIKLTYKDGGTSVGLKIDRGDEKFGKWLPRNSAGNPESQVVSYQLGRFLGMSELVMPSAYYKLDGTALSIFKKLLQGAPERNRWRRENRDINLADIAQNPSGLMGVFTPYLEPKSQEVIGLANPSANTINSADPIARFIRADGPVPSASRRMSLRGIKGGSESELELARRVFTNHGARYFDGTMGPLERRQRRGHHRWVTGLFYGPRQRRCEHERPWYFRQIFTHRHPL